MSDRVTTTRPRHLMTTDVWAHIREVSTLGDVEISDAAALTIASWWQSPGTVGRAFAELASTGSVEYQDLVDDIVATYPEAQAEDGKLSGLGFTQDHPDDPTLNTRALDLLGTWALHHPSRQDG